MKLKGLRGLILGNGGNTQYFDLIVEGYESAATELRRMKSDSSDYTETKARKKYYLDLFSGYVGSLTDSKLITEEQGNQLLDELRYGRRGNGDD